MGSAFITQLKTEWFKRLEHITNQAKTMPSSNLGCTEICQERCCPRIALRQKPPQQVKSSVVVLLPFEMEYLIERTRVSPQSFRRWPLAWTPEDIIEIGMFDLGKVCPFLTNNLQCSIYEFYPLDCRTYPLLPFLNTQRELEWELSEHCPSVSRLNPYFAQAVRLIWRELESALPPAWWDLYAFADHWKGWPEPTEIHHAV